MSSSCGIPPRPLRFVNGPRRGASPTEFGIDPGGLHASLEAFSVKAEPGPDLCGLTAEPGLDLCGLTAEPGLDLCGLTAEPGLDLCGLKVEPGLDLRGLKVE